MDQHTITKRKVNWFTLIGIILAAISALFTKSWTEFLLNATFYCLNLSILEILFKENNSHLEVRNEENIKIWNGKTISIAVVIITEIVAAHTIHHNILQILPLLTSWILSIVSMKLLKESLELGRRTAAEPQEFALHNFNRLDYGCGMAYNYFFGYLKLMLSSPGDERRGIRELIRDYESTHQVQFGARKLFILIPSSTYCPPSLVQCSRIMEASEDLQWRRINRAGVRGRQYHHSVYKLLPVGLRDNPIYVCAEYATPLLTLFEIMQQNTEESRLYRRHQNILVTNFIVTVRKLINDDRACRDLVELIDYEDVDNDGNPFDLDQLDVGNLLLERINYGRNHNNSQ